MRLPPASGATVAEPSVVALPGNDTTGENPSGDSSRSASSITSQGDVGSANDNYNSKAGDGPSQGSGHEVTNKHVIIKRKKLKAMKSVANLSSPNSSTNGSSPAPMAGTGRRDFGKTPGTAASKQKKASSLLSFFGSKPTGFKKKSSSSSDCNSSSSPSKDVCNETTNAENRRSPSTTACGTSSVADNEAGAQEKEVQWVQCERCKKWRTLPDDVSAASLPEQWYCSMNTWDPKYSSCYAKQEADSGDSAMTNEGEETAQKAQSENPKAADSSMPVQLASSIDATTNKSDAGSDSVLLGGIRLSKGWAFSFKTRKKGGHKDKEWVSPNGFKFRSKVGVQRHLALSAKELAALIEAKDTKKTKKRKKPTASKPHQAISTALASFVTKAPPKARSAFDFYLDAQMAKLAKLAELNNVQDKETTQTTVDIKAMVAAWSELDEKERELFVEKAEEDKARFVRDQAIFEKQAQAIFGDAALLQASPKPLAKRLGQEVPAAIRTNPHQADFDLFSTKKQNLLQEARELKSRLEVEPVTDDEITKVINVGADSGTSQENNDAALKQLCSMESRQLLMRLVQGSDLTLPGLCRSILKRFTDLHLLKPKESTMESEMVAEEEAKHMQTLSEAIQLVSRRHSWGEKNSGAVIETDEEPSALWSWEGVDADCLLPSHISTSEKRKFKTLHRSVFQESTKLQLAILASAKVCNLANNPRVAASTVSKAKASFNTTMQRLFKFRANEQEKAKKREATEKAMMEAKRIKEEKQRLHREEQIKKAEMLAAMRKQKADEKEAAKQERLRQAAEQKALKEAAKLEKARQLAAKKAEMEEEKRRLAKEAEERRAAAKVAAAAAKAKKEAAMVGWRKPKPAYSFFVKAMMKDKTLSEEERSFKAIAARWKSVSNEEKAKYTAMHEEDKKKCEEERKEAIANGTFIDRSTNTNKKASKPPVQKNNLFKMFGRQATPSKSSQSSVGTTASSKLDTLSSSNRDSRNDSLILSQGSDKYPKTKLSRAQRRAAEEAQRKAKLEELTTKIDAEFNVCKKTTSELFESWCTSMRKAACAAQEKKLSVAPILISGAPDAPKKYPRSKQLLQFSDNERPPFWGIWSSKDTADEKTLQHTRPLGNAFGYGSYVMSGRRPFAMDKSKNASGIVQYDYDSDEEWVGGEPGEALNSDVEHSDDDDEELAALTAEERNAKEFDMNDGWMCADDVVVYSDDEEYSDAEELEDQDGTGPLDIDRVITKDKKSENKKKRDGEDVLNGSSSDDEDDDDRIPKHRRKIRRVARREVDDAGINNGQVEMFSPVFFSEDFSHRAPLSSEDSTLQDPSTLMQSFRICSLISSPIDPKEFLQASVSDSFGQFIDTQHLPDLCSIVHLSSSISEMVSDFKSMFPGISRKEIKRKIKDIASSCKSIPGISGRCWCVRDDILLSCGLDAPSVRTKQGQGQIQELSGSSEDQVNDNIVPSSTAVKRMKSLYESVEKAILEEKALAAEKEQASNKAQLLREKARMMRAEEAERKKKEAAAKLFHDDLHLSTLLSLVHFTSKPKEVLISSFQSIFPKVSPAIVSRKISQICSRKMFHGGKRWVAKEEFLSNAKLDRDTIMGASEATSVPEPPTVLEDGTTPIDSSTPEGEAFLQKWFCGLSEEVRMRINFSRMDACIASGVAAEKKKEEARKAKEAAKLERIRAKAEKASALEKRKREAAAKLFHDDLHLSTLLSLVHFTSKPKEVLISSFQSIFPKVSPAIVSRKISQICSRKMFHGGKRWVAKEEFLSNAKLDRDTIMGASEATSVPEPPTVLEDGTTPIDSSTPEGEAFLQKWFCGLSEEVRMRINFSRMDACIASGVAAKKRKLKGIPGIDGNQKRRKLTMPVGWRAVQTVRVSGKTAGTLDTMYYSPDGLKKCRSLVEVYRYLESQKSQGKLNVVIGSAKKRKLAAMEGPDVQTTTSKTSRGNPLGLDYKLTSTIVWIKWASTQGKSLQPVKKADKGKKIQWWPAIKSEDPEEYIFIDRYSKQSPLGFSFTFVPKNLIPGACPFLGTEDDISSKMDGLVPGKRLQQAIDIARKRLLDSQGSQDSTGSCSSKSIKVDDADEKPTNGSDVEPVKRKKLKAKKATASSNE